MITKEKFKVFKNVFDEKTLRVLFKLESDGYFEDLVSPIKVGKESNVFSAIKKDGTYVVVKIYRVNNADFKRMYNYIAADSRFEGLSNQRRKVIFAWAQREYRNLFVAREFGANVPLVYAVNDNVLVMELIGEKAECDPLLKDSAPKNVENFYKLLLEDLKKFYKAGFVHGDLSEFNILNHKDKPYVIDLSHGTKLDCDLANQLLERDVKNIVRYFNKLGLKLTYQDVLKEIKNGF
ncbi:serine protein kinase RIO [Candidatus Woesearchaeota archaeon]|nr:serine protein kinase RIO [Candidatus Woesearchaeota archaeon]